MLDMPRNFKNWIVSIRFTLICWLIPSIYFIYSSHGLSNSLKNNLRSKKILSNCNHQSKRAFFVSMTSSESELFYFQKEWPGIITNKKFKNFLATALFIGSLITKPAYADDELAQYAAEGNKVDVDGTCFVKKCALETSACANDPYCLKGLACLARCKGASMCSTGCFAKYGSHRLDALLSCSVEKNDCVHVPGREDSTGWKLDKLSDLPSVPRSNIDISSLDGNWYKIMGLDSRYDCFDCQKNSFKYDKRAKTLAMDAIFRIPRPDPPGFSQNRIEEVLRPADSSSGSIAHLQSRGEMFGLTFWENWYVLGDWKSVKEPAVNSLGVAKVNAGLDVQTNELKLIFYTGHTLQGSYKGAFIYSRTKDLTPELLKEASKIITNAGLNPNDFCIIRNQCFSQINQDSSIREVSSIKDLNQKNVDKKQFPFWYLGQRFFFVTNSIAKELADWFEDPAIVSDWLISQQERMVITQPLAVSPFASLSPEP